MSGMELIGVISGTISIIDATIKIYNAANDASGLPSAFHDINSRLPLIREALQTAHDNLLGKEADGPALSALRACRRKAEELASLCRGVIPLRTDSCVARYYKAARAASKGDKAEGLMQGILADLKALTASHVFKTPTTEQMSDLIESAGMGKGRNPSLKHISTRNTGSGMQIVHSGKGDQMVNAGTGPTINGPVTGPFYFGSPRR